MQPVLHQREKVQEEDQGDCSLAISETDWSEGSVLLDSAIEDIHQMEIWHALRFPVLMFFLCSQEISF